MAACNGFAGLRVIQTLRDASPMFAISRHISLARAQQPLSGYMNGMHGAGAVDGSQLVAFIVSKSHCACFNETK